MPFAATLLGHGILLTHGNRDVVGDIAQLLDSGRDFLDGLNRSWRRLFDRHDVPRDFLGGLAGLWGKAFDLLGHHRETTAGFAGTRGLYCRVEGKQICLRGNAADEVADFADFVDRCGEAFCGIGSCLCLAGCLARDCRRICDAGCDMFDRLGDFLGGRRDYSDIRCRLFRRCRGGEGLFLIARGAGRHVTRGTVHGNCRPIEGFGDVGYRPLEFPGGGFDELPARFKCAGLFALLAAGGRRVRGCLAKEYEGAPHIRDFIALELKPTHTQAKNTVHPPWRRHGGCSGRQPQGVKPCELPGTR